MKKLKNKTENKNAGPIISEENAIINGRNEKCNHRTLQTR